MHVSAISPFKGKSSTTSLIIFPCLYIVFCHMFPNNFLNVSQHTQHTLGWAQPVIGLIMPSGTQLRELVVLELWWIVSFYFYICKSCTQLTDHVTNGSFTMMSVCTMAILYLACLYLSKWTRSFPPVQTLQSPLDLNTSLHFKNFVAFYCIIYLHLLYHLTSSPCTIASYHLCLTPYLSLKAFVK